MKKLQKRARGRAGLRRLRRAQRRGHSTPLQLIKVPEWRRATIEGMTASGSPRQAPLAMDATTFRVLGHALVDQVADLLASIPARPLTRDLSTNY